jgi:hypothetical protein
MRRFALGVITLFIGAMFFFVAFGVNVVTVTDEAPAFLPLIPLVLAVCFVLVTAALWVGAIRSAEGDDEFSGERGRLVAAMIVATLAIGVTLLFFAFNPGSWQGFIDGWRS